MQGIFELVNANTAVSVAVIVLGTLLAGLMVDLFTTRVIMRLTSKTRTNLDDEIIAALRRPLYLSVLLVGIGVVLWRLGTADRWQRLSHRVLITFAVLIWTRAGIRIGKAVLLIISRRKRQHGLIQPSTVPLFDISLRTLLIGGAAYGILLAWNVDVTAWLASAGILGIAIGFAAKDTLANFFSGIFIIADAPYKIGDYVVLGTGERGCVTEIGIRSTRILTRDDIEVIIPNATIASSMIVNESGGPYPKARVRVDVGVAYGSDIDRVRSVLTEIADQCPLLCQDPEPRIRFRALGNSSLDFQVLGWIEEPALRGQAIDELLTSIYQRFKAEGIVIPFPQRDVHLIRE